MTPPQTEWYIWQRLSDGWVAVKGERYVVRFPTRDIAETKAYELARENPGHEFRAGDRDGPVDD